MLRHSRPIVKERALGNWKGRQPLLLATRGKASPSAWLVQEDNTR